MKIIVYIASELQYYLHMLIGTELRGKRRLNMAKQTANEAYNERLQEVKRLMAKLDEHIKEHHSRQSVDQKNWGFAGDLEYYAGLLKQIVEPEQ